MQNGASFLNNKKLVMQHMMKKVRKTRINAKCTNLSIESKPNTKPSISASKPPKFAVKAARKVRNFQNIANSNQSHHHQQQYNLF